MHLDARRRHRSNLTAIEIFEKQSRSFAFIRTGEDESSAAGLPDRQRLQANVTNIDFSLFTGPDRHIGRTSDP